MTLPVLGWRIGSWFLQCILARVNKFSIYGFGLYLNFQQINYHNYKSFNYNIITLSCGFGGIFVYFPVFITKFDLLDFVFSLKCMG